MFINILLLLSSIQLFAETDDVTTKNSKYEFGIKTLAGRDRYLDNELSGSYFFDTLALVNLNLRSTRFEGVALSRGIDVGLTFQSFSDQTTSIVMGGNRIENSLGQSHLELKQAFYFLDFNTLLQKSELAVLADFIQFRDLSNKEIIKQDSLGMIWRQYFNESFDLSFGYTKFIVRKKSIEKLNSLYSNFVPNGTGLTLAIGGILDHILDLNFGWRFTNSHRLELSLCNFTPYKGQGFESVLTGVGIDWSINSKWKTNFNISSSKVSNEIATQFVGVGISFTP